MFMRRWKAFLSINAHQITVLRVFRRVTNSFRFLGLINNRERRVCEENKSCGCNRATQVSPKVVYADYILDPDVYPAQWRLEPISEKERHWQVLWQLIKMEKSINFGKRISSAQQVSSKWA